MRELLTAIGLTACHQVEVAIELRQGWPISSPEVFLAHATPLFLLPVEFLRALQLGIKFTQPPPGVKLALVGNDGGQGGGGLGGHHRVGGGAQRVYPLRRNPQ